MKRYRRDGVQVYEPVYEGTVGRTSVGASFVLLRVVEDVLVGMTMFKKTFRAKTGMSCCYSPVIPPFAHQHHTWLPTSYQASDVRLPCTAERRWVD